MVLQAYPAAPTHKAGNIQDSANEFPTAPGHAVRSVIRFPSLLYPPHLALTNSHLASHSGFGSSVISWLLTRVAFHSCISTGGRQFWSARSRSAA